MRYRRRRQYVGAFCPMCGKGMPHGWCPPCRNRIERPKTLNIYPSESGPVDRGSKAINLPPDFND